MLGRIRWTDGRKMRLGQEQIQGMTLLALDLPIRERGYEKRLRKGCELLLKNRVTRVLAPPEFSGWEALISYGLRPVDTLALRCALAPVWVKASLAAAGIRPEQAIITLAGSRERPDMEQVARVLCPMVRNLVIDVPKGGRMAADLRREFGLPVLPARSSRSDLTLRFESGPVLEGGRFVLKSTSLPPDCELLPLLSALWECGKVKTEEIVLRV